jgi:hypothetical protein
MLGGLLSLNEEMLDASTLSVSQRTIAGRDSQCFDIDNFLVTGTVCYSTDGLPLLIEARDTRGGTTQTALAVEIENTPIESELQKQLVSQPPYSFAVTDFNAHDVSLPLLPIVGRLADDRGGENDF